MNRIEQAKEACSIIVPEDMEHGTPFAAGYNKGIEAGVKWADSHPRWHKYPKEKPPKDTDDVSKVVFVLTKNVRLPIKARMFYERRAQNDFQILNLEYWYSLELGHHINKEDIIAWMEMPEFIIL